MTASPSHPSHPSHPSDPGYPSYPGALDPELAAALAQVRDPDGRFGHRQHVHLAFLAARWHGTERAADVMCRWIGEIARQHGAPQQYHTTMTIAWARLVAYHVAGDPCVSDFGAFAALHPALLDKDLLARHYAGPTLRSDTARATWVPPDLAELPAR
jgi:hypothetical protein